MRFLLFSLLLLPPYYLPLNNIQKNIFIIWNVGQGSWSSLITKEACFHFDMGGYKIIKKNIIMQQCKNKKNILLLTHADKDHINLIYYFPKKYTQLCLYKKPRKVFRKKKKKILNQLPICKNADLLLKKYNIIEISFFIPKNYSKKKLSANFLSRVFLINNLILIGGDSTKKAEALWKDNIPFPEKIKYFLLNHHGSKNSNHPQLLEKLNNLNAAIASAKKSRYQHPHKKIIKFLQKQKINLLQTEIWGSIYIYL